MCVKDICRNSDGKWTILYLDDRFMSAPLVRSLLLANLDTVCQGHVQARAHTCGDATLELCNARNTLQQVYLNPQCHPLSCQRWASIVHFFENATPPPVQYELTRFH